MAQALAQQVAPATGVERQRPLDEGVDVVEHLVVLGERHDLAGGVGPQVRTDVDHDESGQPVGAFAGEADGGEPAHRLPDDDRPGEGEVVDDGGHVGGQRGVAVVAVGRPLRVAVAAEVDGDAVVTPAQRQRHEVPGPRRQAAAVEQDERWRGGGGLVGPPFDQVEPDAVGDDVVLERESDVVDGESGAADPGPQVVERRRRHWMTSPPFTFIVSPTM